MTELSQEAKNHIFARMKNELDRLEAARQKRIAASQKSFGEWLVGTIGKASRALGYVISVPIEKTKNIWNWLFG